MDSQWSMIWTHSNAAARKPKTRRDAFADPLERPEWDGLEWAVWLISRLVSAGRGTARQQRKTQAVERFTGSATARSVCVS